MKVWLTAFLVAWAGYNPARIVCLQGHPSVDGEYHRRPIVVTGTVQRDTPAPARAGYFEGRTYLVRIDERFRGADSTKTLLIFSENSTGRFPMSVAGRYLLLVYREKGRLFVDNCGNSGELVQRRAAVARLRRLVRNQ